jgi:hypothetical protein
MKKAKEPELDGKLDFSKAVRGRFFDLVQNGTNVVLIEPDLLETFPDSEAVNTALRSLKEIADRTAKRPVASVKPSRRASMAK